MVTEQPQRRFSIDKNHYVVDKAHPNQVKKFKYDYNPKDSDSQIRRCMLAQGIGRLLPKLIVGSEASSIRHHLWVMLLATLETSQLNSQDPLLAIQYPFKGKLGSKKGIQDYTSISLFVRDVERLLRELYGDFDRNELSMALYATREVVNGLLTFVRPDLLAEYWDADSSDYSVGINVPEGCGISGSQPGAGLMAGKVLAIRALQVRANRSAHCRYTIKFVKALDKYWPKLGGFDRHGEDEILGLEEE